MPRPFYGYNIPIALQSTCIKDYALKNNMSFSLPVTEITKNECFTMLEYLLEENGDIISNLGVVSGFVFPIFNTEILKKIFNSKKNIINLKIHIVLENKIFSPAELILWAEDIVEKNKLTKDYSQKMKL